MEVDEQQIARMSAVTISRQYGSGGGEIAARLARRLSWDLVDHVIVAQVAHQLGMSEEEALARDEWAPSLVSRLVDAILLIAPPEIPTTPDDLPVDKERRYHETVRQAITAAVQRGHVVIVGRGAQALCSDRVDVLNVRVVAPLSKRIAYVALREGLDSAAAQERVKIKDRDRTHYMGTYYHRGLDDPLLYDLVVNTDVLDLDSICDLIVIGLAHKAQQLSSPPSALGPAIGLTRYRGQPGDFPLSSWADD